MNTKKNIKLDLIAIEKTIKTIKNITLVLIAIVAVLYVGIYFWAVPNEKSAMPAIEQKTPENASETPKVEYEYVPANERGK